MLAVSDVDEPMLLRKSIGKGNVYFLNSYSHIGRGHMRDLAEGIIRTLVEQQAVPVRIEDPSEVALSIVLECYKPSLWYFGHFHTSASGSTNDCHWTCLNEGGRAGNYVGHV